SVQVALPIVRGGYEALSSEVGDALGELEKELESGDEDTSEVDQLSDAQVIEDAPVTKIVATILRYATEGGASDIHIEPTDVETQVRFRIDGVMRRSLSLPKTVHSAVVA